MPIDSKRIAKNTIYMYIRLIIVMAVTLYAARVVLDKLGAEDYGIFNAVAWVVGMLSFLNNTLAKGTSRFLTYELGRGYKKTLSDTFSTAIISHIILAILIVILLELVGVWFVSNKLIIPEERMNAALWCFQLSLVPTFLGIILVPYSASIIAHEDMGVYAYIGLVEAGAKLGIVYLLSVTSFDKLVFYTFLLALVQLLLFVFYFVFCRRNYAETKPSKVFKKDILKEMLGFSGWNLFTHFAVMLSVQGSSVLLGMFFKPVIVAAQSIANQVTTALMNFVYNFTTALNPQIIKSYAVGDYEDSKKLTLESTVFVFDLVLLICLPFCFTIETVLGLWLVDVPDYTVVFCRFILIAQIFNVFNVTFYTPMMASGKLKTNSIWAIAMEVIRFIILYVIFKAGGGVLWLQYSVIAATVIWSFAIKPGILYKEIGYNRQELIDCYISCGKVLVPSVVLSGILSAFIGSGLVNHVVLFVCIVIIVGGNSILFMKASIREKLLYMVHNKLKK